MTHQEKQEEASRKEDCQGGAPVPCQADPCQEGASQ